MPLQTLLSGSLGASSRASHSWPTYIPLVGGAGFYPDLFCYAERALSAHGVYSMGQACVLSGSTIHADVPQLRPPRIRLRLVLEALHGDALRTHVSHETDIVTR